VALRIEAGAGDFDEASVLSTAIEGELTQVGGAYLPSG